MAITLFLWILAAAVGVSRSLPSLYRATVTVLVERQQLPQSFVRSTVTNQIDAQIQTISQKILSRPRLEGLINRFDLYPVLRKKDPLLALIPQMRRDIQLERKEAQAAGRNETISFTLSYLGPDPQTVAQVTNALASFYVRENLHSREQAATGTADFLETQLSGMKTRLNAQEDRINRFKERYGGELPQQMPVIMATLERLNTELSLNKDKQLRAMERRDALEGQIADNATAGFGAGLSGPLDGAGTVSAPNPIAVRIAKLTQDLTELRTRFTEQYPDVVRVKSEISALKEQLAAEKKDSGTEKGLASRQNSVSGEKTLSQRTSASRVDPSLLPLKSALDEADAEIKSLKDQEKILRRSIATYEHRVESSPLREQQLQALSRDYQTTSDLYASLQKRYEEAQMSESMERGQKGERFQILEPAIPPMSPASPRRLRLLVLGLFMSLAVAAGAVVFSEKLDSTFHSASDLRAFTRIPVLASIPRIVTRADSTRRKLKFFFGALAVLLILALILAGSYFLAHGNIGLVRILARAHF